MKDMKSTKTAGMKNTNAKTAKSETTNEKIDLGVNLYNVLTELSGNGYREGRCFKFKSPFREERTASFAVYPESNSWFDFGSGEGGDIISFFRKLYNCSYRDALNEIEAFALLSRGVPARQTPVEIEPPPPRVRPKIKPVQMDDYFKSVGLDLPPDTGAFTLRLGKGEYVAFPCPDRNNPKGLECKLISGEGLRRLSLFKKEIWFYKRESSHIAITESIFDTLALYTLENNLGDFSFSLCAMNGLSNKNKVVDFITKVKPRWVSLALDNDSHGAGQNIQEELTEIFKEAGFKVEDLSWHYKREGIKDFYRLLQAIRKEPGYDYI